MTSNIIPVGNDTDSLFVAYGDDSQTDFSLAYAFLILRRWQIEEIEKRILDLKQRFEFPCNTPLHCRVLLHEHPRKKYGLAHLTNYDARSIIEKSIGIINKNKILVRYATADLRAIEGKLGPDITLEDVNGIDHLTLPLKTEPKTILGILMQACFTVPADGSDGPTASQCQIFASADSTKIQFIGEKKRQAHNLYNGFSDIGAEKGMVSQLQPTICTVNTAPILQLADVASYVCSHAMTGNDSDYFYRNQLGKIKSYVHQKFNV